MIETLVIQIAIAAVFLGLAGNGCACVSTAYRAWGQPGFMAGVSRWGAMAGASINAALAGRIAYAIVANGMIPSLI